MLRRSASGTSSPATGSLTFSTGSDSPVRADSWARRLAEWTTRASAGTSAPASTATTSPTTTSRRRHFGETAVTTEPHSRGGQRRSAAMVFSARYSCLKPSRPLSTTMATIAMASSKSPSAAETTAAMIRMRMRSEVNCSSRMRQRLLAPCWTSSLGPCATSRRRASSSGQAVGGTRDFSQCLVGGEQVPVVMSLPASVPAERP